MDAELVVRLVLNTFLGCRFDPFAERLKLPAAVSDRHDDVLGAGLRNAHARSGPVEQLNRGAD